MLSKAYPLFFVSIQLFATELQNAPIVPETVITGEILEPTAPEPIAEASEIVESTPIVLLDEKEQEPSEETCGKGPRPYYFTMRHIEGNGIGYDQGYTTLEGFFRATNPETWVPFLDVRYHFFNNGKPALNAGVGLRYLAASRIWGINAYYDYRKTRHQHYNQVSVGLESLGKVWDFRINGYLPVGNKKSDLYDLQVVGFQNHYLYLSQKFEYVLKGANAEIGAHISRYKRFPLYLTAGPYYLEGEDKRIWGGQGRLVANVLDNVRLEGIASYDNHFKWIGQGQISLVIPFGGKKQLRARQDRSCSMQLTLAERAVQRVDRMEIIPVRHEKVESLAIDPLTGNPYFFWFVNNTSSSDGTFESPFPTLVQAQNASAPYDVIYVYPGDGTTTGMDAGILLQNYQRLWGAGINQILPTTLGTITIPAMANSLPLLTNTGGSHTITPDDNNEISGFHLLGTAGSLTDGIVHCNAITNLNFHNNTIDFASSSFNGIFMDNCLGQITIADTLINHHPLSITTPKAFLIDVTAAQSTRYLFANNTVINTNTIGNYYKGLQVQATSDMGIIEMVDNHLTKVASIVIIPSIPNDGFLNGSASFIFEGNTITDGIAQTGFGNVNLTINTGGNLNAQIIDNQWINGTSVRARVDKNGPTTACVSLLNNKSTPPSVSYVLNNFGAPNTFTADIANNEGTVTTSGTIDEGVCP